MFDSNNEKEKSAKMIVGEGKCIQMWETGVIGMKKGGKRIIVGYNDSQKVPETTPLNSLVIFLVIL